MHDLLPLFQVFQNKPERRLFRNGRDRSGLENMIGAEQFLRITVNVALVLAGEIQVDIRLFIAIESQERFKRNVMPVPIHGPPANGTVLRRKVEPGTHAAVGEKFAVLAFRADIVGRPP